MFNEKTTFLDEELPPSPFLAALQYAALGRSAHPVSQSLEPQSLRHQRIGGCLLCISVAYASMDDMGWVDG